MGCCERPGGLGRTQQTSKSAADEPPTRGKMPEVFFKLARLKRTNSIMILPQVHLRKPCYDFYFL